MRQGEVLAGKYEIERVVGRGGMGVVYLARKVQGGERVAVKLMLPGPAKSAESVARFVREAQAAMKIQSEHVVKVFDVGTLDDGRPYMAMEYLEGGDLRDVLAARHRLPLPETAEYLLQALEALSEAHAVGIVHRDLKPGNLFVTRRAESKPLVKVLDFGISKIVHGALVPADPLTNVSQMMGSPLYMSPEQMKASRSIDMRSDIWSLGVILYELLTGEVPFKGESLPELCAMIVLEADSPRASDVVPELPPAIDEVIARCLARNVDERFANAAELARALAPFAPEHARVSVDRVTTALGPLASLPPSARAASAPTASTALPTEPAESPRRAPIGMLIGGAAATLLLVYYAVVSSSFRARPVERDTTKRPAPSAVAPLSKPLVVPTPNASAPAETAPFASAAASASSAASAASQVAAVQSAPHARGSSSAKSAAPLKPRAPGPAPARPSSATDADSPFGGRR